MKLVESKVSEILKYSNDGFGFNAVGNYRFHFLTIFPKKYFKIFILKWEII
jgi:hypothetical protein